MAQFTLDLLRKHGIKQDTTLGQHFLVDDNILDVIERLSDLNAEDVVYEPGPGVGILTVRLAERVRTVHAVELDQRLEPVWPEILDAHPNIQLHWGDAVQLSAAAVAPDCTALVSNLPYHVAGPIIAEAIQHAPLVTRYCVMVQREVADRLFCAVGGSNFGALSVVVQATCRKTGLHNVGRGVFAPPPNVDSALCAFRRRDDVDIDPNDVPAWSSFVRGCFSQRRKTLSNNLVNVVGLSRDAATAAIATAGLATSVRPQAVDPDTFIQLWHAVRAARGDAE